MTEHASPSGHRHVPDDLVELSALEVRELFRKRQLSPVEYLEALLARIDRQEPRVNALTEMLTHEARTAARLAERVYLEETDRAQRPLLGIPVATKEKHALAGHTLSQGLLSQAGALAAEDSAVVQRIRAAGGYVHARTTSPEFSCATVTHSTLWGVTRNPWNPELSPGGSSGGAGAALAAGYAPLASASDIAGSTRIPAGFTGTVGYKAPYGRIPGAPPLSLDWYRGDGPMARTVADTALFTAVLAGRDQRDHASLPAPRSAGEWLAAADPEPGVAGMRVALSLTLGDYPVSADVAAAVQGVAQALEGAGARVEEVELPWTTELIREASFTHFGHILAPAMRAQTAGQEDRLADYTLRFMADAEAAASRRSFYEGLAMEAAIQAQLAEAMAGFDVLLTPVSAVSGLAADGSYLEGIDVPETAAGRGGTRHLQHYWEGHMTSPFNIANRVPVLAVPAGVTEAGIPAGVQIVGHPYDELPVFRVGAAIEALRPWPRLAPV